ncbi:MAG: CRISPR-associated endoribonuclease Cas6, partial [Nanoarchaeota archaeon]
ILNLITGSPLYVKYKNRSWTPQDSNYYLINSLQTLSLKRFFFYLEFLEKKDLILSSKKEKIKNRINKKLETIYYPLFLKVEIKKTIPVAFDIKGKLRTFITHRALIDFVNIDKELTNFIVDNGIGNLNAMGFGFLNIIKT